MTLPYTVADLAIGNALPESWVDNVRLNLDVLDARTAVGAATLTDYVQATGTASISAVNEPTAQTVLNGNTKSYNSRAKRIAFFCPNCHNESAGNPSMMAFVVMRGTSPIGYFVKGHNSSSGTGGWDTAMFAQIFDLTPPAASYAYSVKSWVHYANGAFGGAGTWHLIGWGISVATPMYMAVNEA